MHTAYFFTHKRPSITCNGRQYHRRSSTLSFFLLVTLPNLVGYSIIYSAALSSCCRVIYSVPNIVSNTWCKALGTSWRMAGDVIDHATTISHILCLSEVLGGHLPPPSSDRWPCRWIWLRNELAIRCHVMSRLLSSSCHQYSSVDPSTVTRHAVM